MHPPPLTRAPGVVIQRSSDHHFVFHGVEGEFGEYRCRHCNATARTASSLASLRSGSLRLCAPDHIQRLAAKRFFEATTLCWDDVTDNRVTVALEAAAGLLGPAAPAPARPPLPQESDADDLAAFAELGHDVFQGGEMLCCRRCGGCCNVQDFRTARKLRRECQGLSKNPATRRNQLSAIDRVGRGLAPRQRGPA